MRRVAAVALLALACVSHPKPTQADLDATITRADFADWLSGYSLATRHERLDKSEKSGIAILEYDYLGDDGKIGIAVHSRVYWTKTLVESAAAYQKMLSDAQTSRDRDGIAWIPVLTG